MTWTVMIVDDEEMTRNLLRLMLTPAGYTVVEAEDGVDAMEKIAARPPDIVLLDVMMPRMDGIEVCRAVRRQPETAALPIIMVSAKTSHQAVEEGLAAGANKYLSKPIARKHLLAVLDEVLQPTNA
ncbi:MAG: response regulator [Anaerolineales bacterium]|nr:response regulator [Anaerolineales bacterium]